MTKLLPYRPQGGESLPIYNIGQADSKQAIFLGSSAAEGITSPDLARVAIFICDNPVFYERDATPTIPTAEETSGSAWYVPADKMEGDSGLVGGTSTLNFIRSLATNTIITIYFFNYQ